MNDDRVHKAGADVDAQARGGRPKLKSGMRGRPSLIARDSLHNTLLARLRSMIQDGELAPGEQVVESSLCTHFGVSRTPLREALKVLSSEGLVELRPRRTPVVTSVDPVEILAIFEVLEGLEFVAGRVACENATDTDRAELAAMHAAMIAKHDAGDRVAYQTVNRSIHFRIVDCTRNPVLSATYANLMTRIARARSTNNFDPIRWFRSREEHERIIAAFLAGDADGVSAALVDHTRETGQAVVATLRRFSSAEPGRISA